MRSISIRQVLSRVGLTSLLKISVGYESSVCTKSSKVVPTLEMTSKQRELHGMRVDYSVNGGTLDVKDLVSMDPIIQFKSWFNDGCNCPDIIEPNAMALATADKNGKPSVRMVLLKSFDDTGFTFFTNHNSRKGQELAENPNCSLMFYWPPFYRSVRVEGVASRISQSKNNEYFVTRPKDSMVAAICSDQSRVIPDRKCLDTQFEEFCSKYENVDSIPCPSYWGGYLVKPYSLEFWQGRKARVHDRLRFRIPETGENIDGKLTHSAANGWVYERLAP